MRSFGPVAREVVDEGTERGGAWSISFCRSDALPPSRCKERETRGEIMRHKAALVLVLCLAAVAMFCVGASAAAADTVWPGVGTAHVAHVWPRRSLVDGRGRLGRRHRLPLRDADPGAGQRRPSTWRSSDPTRRHGGMSQILLNSVTVTAPRRQRRRDDHRSESAQYWSPVKWYPAANGWWRGWEAHVGQLPAGTYQVTWVLRQPTAIVVSVSTTTATGCPPSSKALQGHLQI